MNIMVPKKMLIYFNRYQIMIQCWNEDPNNRPTFNRLREITTEFIQEEVGQSLINVTVIAVCHIEIIEEYIRLKKLIDWPN